MAPLASRVSIYLPSNRSSFSSSPLPAVPTPTSPSRHLPPFKSHRTSTIMQHRSKRIHRLNRTIRLQRSQLVAQIKRTNRMRALLKAKVTRPVPARLYQRFVAPHSQPVPTSLDVPPPSPPVLFPAQVVQQHFDLNMSNNLRDYGGNTVPILPPAPTAMDARSASIMDLGEDDRSSVRSMTTADSMASFYTDPHPTSPRLAPLARQLSEPMSIDSHSTSCMEIEDDDASTVRSRGSPTPVPAPCHCHHTVTAPQPNCPPAPHFRQEVLPLQIRYDILRKFVQQLHRSMNSEVLYSAMDTGLLRD